MGMRVLVLSNLTVVHLVLIFCGLLSHWLLSLSLSLYRLRGDIFGIRGPVIAESSYMD
jgi:hypothetical protein